MPTLSKFQLAAKLSLRDVFLIPGTILVEPAYEVSSHDSLLYPARSIANVHNGHVPVKIANAYSFPVKICARTCIGMAEQFDEEKTYSEKRKSSSDNSSDDYWLNNIDLQNCALSEHERALLIALLQEYHDVFVKSDMNSVKPIDSRMKYTRVIILLLGKGLIGFPMPS